MHASDALQLGKHKEAIADASTCLDIVPNSWKALRTRGNAHLALRNFERALADLTKAVQICSFPDERTILQRDLAEAQRGIRSQSGVATPALGGRVTPSLVPGKDYYRILSTSPSSNGRRRPYARADVGRTASEAEVRQAFRQRSITHHPRNVRGHSSLH